MSYPKPTIGSASNCCSLAVIPLHTPFTEDELRKAMDAAKGPWPYNGFMATSVKVPKGQEQEPVMRVYKNYYGSGKDYSYPEWPARTDGGYGSTTPKESIDALKAVGFQSIAQFLAPKSKNTVTIWFYAKPEGRVLSEESK